MTNKVEIIIKADELISAMTRLAVALEGQQGKTTTEPATVSAEEPVSQKEKKPVTIEQVRAVLAAKSQAGKQAAVKDLITKYGAAKLTEIPPAKYAELLKEAEEL